MLTDFFNEYPDIVLFIHGLVFVILGTIIFLQLRVTEKSEYKLLNILWLLASFAVTYGIYEFMNILINMFAAINDKFVFSFYILNPTFLFISYLCLFLFGYQLININRRKPPSIWFISIILILFFEIITYLERNNYNQLEDISNYFLGFPGAILSAIGFLLYYESESKKLSEINVKKYFIFAALFFGIYGILGVIVSRDSFFPASVMNQTSFIYLFGTPVVVFRTVTIVGIFWSLWHIVNIFNIEGTSKRRRTEEKIRDQAALLDKARDAIFVWDMEHHITYWNKSAERLYGFTEEEVIGKNSDEFLYREESPVSIETRKKVIEKGEWTGELRHRTREGKEIIVESRWTLVRDNEGKPKSILVIDTDVSEKKKLEMQVLQSDKLATIGNLVAGMAHEINNPLTSISLHTQILSKKIWDENTKSRLKIIDNEACRAARIVKGLLEFSHQSEPKLSPVNINSEIDKVLEILHPKLKGIRITTILKPLPSIMADNEQIQQVIMNILMNSVQAITTNGEIMIKTTAERDTIEISITDNGCGIPQDNIRKIFDPFFTTKNPGEGTGLGLSICYGIIKNHNGSIDMKSEVGKGTSFTIKLPN
ncbi:MAG: ATP-binding protein [Candidatus Methanoperedens sp.]|nr:ATP-binding protein [Candidatus Methanoperedens sp.]